MADGNMKKNMKKRMQGKYQHPRLKNWKIFKSERSFDQPFIKRLTLEVSL